MAKEKKDPVVNADTKGDRADQLGAVAEGAKKKYGHRVLIGASEEEVLVVPRITTGLYGMDLVTNGGIPQGRITMWYGERSTGKTSKVLRVLGNAQRVCANCYRPAELQDGVITLPNLKTGKKEEIETKVVADCECGNPKNFLCLWVDAEKVWLSSWSKKMGVLPGGVMVMRPEYGEQAYDIALAMVNRGIIDAIAIDSLAALAPKEEMESSMEQAHQGVSARMNNKFLRKLVMAMNYCANTYGSSPSLWLINQYREKIGVMFGDPRVLTGGKGQGFAPTMEIECSPGKIDKDKETKEVYSAEFNYYIKKNKVGVPFGRGSYSMCLTNTSLFEVGDLMEHRLVIEHAVVNGFIDKPSSVTYEFNGEKFKGMSQMVLYLGENPDEYEKLKREMLRLKLGIVDSDD
jgi:recombination protein RecA